MGIKLNKIIDLDKSEYKEWTFCLNKAPNENIYSFEENKERLLEHISWKKNPDTKTSFRIINTKYCLHFLRLDKDLKYDNWLFLGAFENKGVIIFPDGHETYNLKPIERFSEYKDRLVIKFKKQQGPKQAKININNIETIEIIKILEKPYIKTNLEFKGYDNISLPFRKLKQIIDANVDNWRELLSNVNAVYVITDMKTGKLYIGSTYGYNGIWQRWSTYVNTNGTGKNKELEEIIKLNPNYAFENFKFTVLECFFNIDGNQKYVMDREKYWTKVFETIKFGYNTHL